MNKVLRIGLVVLSVILIGAILFGTWFYTTIPDPPSLPSNFAIEDTTNVELNKFRVELIQMQWVDEAVREQIQEAIRESGTEGIANVIHLKRLSFL